MHKALIDPYRCLYLQLCNWGPVKSWTPVETPGSDPQNSDPRPDPKPGSAGEAPAPVSPAPGSESPTEMPQKYTKMIESDRERQGYAKLIIIILLWLYYYYHILSLYKLLKIWYHRTSATTHRLHLRILENLQHFLASASSASVQMGNEANYSGSKLFCW